MLTQYLNRGCSYKSVLSLQVACRICHLLNIWKMARSRRVTSCEMSLLIFSCLFASFWSTVIPFATKSLGKNDSIKEECGWRIYGDPRIYRSQSIFDLYNVLLSLSVSLLTIIFWFWKVKKILLNLIGPANRPMVKNMQRNMLRGISAIVSFDLITSLPTPLAFVLFSNNFSQSENMRYANLIATIMFIPMTLQPVCRIFGILSLDSIFRQNLFDFLMRRIRVNSDSQGMNLEDYMDTIAAKYSVASDIDFDAEETANL